MNLADLLKQMSLSNWYELEGRSSTVGALNTGQQALEFKRGAKWHTLTNFVPATKVVPATPRAQVAALTYLLGDVEQTAGIKLTDKSRVEEIAAWFMNHEKAKMKEVAKMQEVGTKGAIEEKDATIPSIGEYVKLIGTAALADVMDENAQSKGDTVRRSVAFCAQEVERWNAVMRSRKYPDFADKEFCDPVRKLVGQVFNFSATDVAPVFPVLPTMANTKTQSVAATSAEFNDALAQTKPEVASAQYGDIDLWNRMFLFHQSTHLANKLRGAKVTMNMATIYPDKKANVPDSLKHIFKSDVVSFDKTAMIGDARSYVFNRLGADGKPVGKVNVSKDAYNSFRKVCCPKVKMLDGTEAVYVKANRKTGIDWATNPDQSHEYVYERADGTTVVIDKKAHEQTMITNAKLGNPKSELLSEQSPVSVSTRGTIKDVIQKFVITNTPRKMEQFKPQSSREQEELADVLEGKVQGSYEPLWERVSMEVDPAKRELLISAGMKSLLSVPVPVPTADDIKRLETVETKTRKRLADIVTEKANQAAVVQYCEAKYGKPGSSSTNYDTYSAIGKYKAWCSDLSSMASTPADKQSVVQKLHEAAAEALGPNRYEALIPATHQAAKVQTHFHTNMFREFTDIARLRGINSPIKSLPDAARTLGYDFSLMAYQSYGARFAEHFELAKELPYVVRQFEGQEPKAIYNPDVATRNLDRGMYTQRPDTKITEAMQKKFASADEAMADPRLKGLTESALRAYESYYSAYAEGDTTTLTDIKDVLEAAAKGHMDGEIQGLLGKKFTQADAKKVLKLIEPEAPEMPM